VVVGAGVAGLGSALILGRAGHEVTLLERDPAPPADPEEAWEEWERRGVPQARLAHVFMGRMRKMMRDEHPELYDALLAAGASEIRFAKTMPSSMDRTPVPQDDDQVILGMRRVLLEHHLRRALDVSPAVTIRSSAPVKAVRTGDPVDGIPLVVGVTLEDGTEVDADLVVDCAGRRSPLPGWVEALTGSTPPESVTEDGLMYFGRYYRLEDGQSFPDQSGGLINDLGYLFSLTFEADCGYFAIALAVHAEDKAIRSLRDEETFERALLAMPHTAKWRTPGLSRPVTEVKSMSRIDDRWRDLVVDGRPLVAGLVAVGDAHVATNPAFGRGSTLAWMMAAELRDAISQHDGDVVAIATAYETALNGEVRSWYDFTADADAGRLRTMDAILAGEPPPAPDPDDPSEAFGTGFQLAAQQDPVMFRALGQVVNMFQLPIELLADPDLATRAILAYEGRPAGGLVQPTPTRDELLAAMGVT
jgi:2-polyprenyl-6-methoxyphenol hydroxylase-like FAD-dependent oxidoreductase